MTDTEYGFIDPDKPDEQTEENPTDTIEELDYVTNSPPYYGAKNNSEPEKGEGTDASDVISVVGSWLRSLLT